MYKYAQRHPLRLVYVALSQATGLDGLYLTSANGDLKLHQAAGSVDHYLVDEMTRLANHRLHTTMEQAQEFVNKHNFEKNVILTAINGQSLGAHVVDLEGDLVISRAGLLTLSETWSNKPASISRSELVGHSKCLSSRCAGISLYKSVLIRHFTITPVALHLLPQVQGMLEHNKITDISAWVT